MASRIVTTTEYTDDIDGGKAEGTVPFSYDGVQYEIDLSKKNKTAMDKAFKPHLDAARRVRPVRAVRGRASTATTPAGRRSDLAAVREWLRGQGEQVRDRGRIPRALIERYDAAH